MAGVAVLALVGVKLQIDANDRIQREQSARERYSVPFFYDPDVAYQVAPLPGLGDPKFPPVQFGEFLRSELEASYDTHKSDDGT